MNYYLVASPKYLPKVIDFPSSPIKQLHAPPYEESKLARMLAIEVSKSLSANIQN